MYTVHINPDIYHVKYSCEVTRSRLTCLALWGGYILASLSTTHPRTTHQPLSYHCQYNILVSLVKYSIYYTQQASALKNVCNSTVPGRNTL